MWKKLNCSIYVSWDRILISFHLGNYWVQSLGSHTHTHAQKSKEKKIQSKLTCTSKILEQNQKYPNEYKKCLHFFECTHAQMTHQFKCVRFRRVFRQDCSQWLWSKVLIIIFGKILFSEIIISYFRILFWTRPIRWNSSISNDMISSLVRTHDCKAT